MALSYSGLADCEKKQGIDLYLYKYQRFEEIDQEEYFKNYEKDVKRNNEIEEFFKEEENFEAGNS